MTNVVDLAAARARRGEPPFVAADLGALVKKPAVAAHFKVSERTIERWMKHGMPYEKPFDGGPVRFRIADCERWFARRC